MHDLPVHGTALPITVLKLPTVRLTLMPACCHDACSASIICFVAAEPIAYGSENWSFVPAGTPHFAASMQVVTPFGSTFQPCDVSRSIALFGLYEYGF